MNLEHIIKQSRPNLKESSIKNYARTIKKLNNNEEVKSITFLKDTEKVIENLKQYKNNSQKNYITGILVVLSAFEGYDDQVVIYRERLETLTQLYYDDLIKNQKNAMDNKNYLSLKQLRAVATYYENEVVDRGLHRKNKKPKPRHKKLLVNMLITNLYTRIPPIKLDYNVEIINNEEDIQEKKNYLVNKSRNNKYFLIQSYNKPLKIKLDKKINKIMNYYLRHHDSEFLFVNKNGNNLTKNSLGKLLSNSFKPTQKNITLQLIKKIWDDELNKEEKKT